MKGSRNTKATRGLRAIAAACALTLAAIAGATQAEAGQGTVPMTIKGIDAAQTEAPVFTGMPFPPGELRDPGLIELRVDGAAVPVQKSVLSRYSDGSVRVLLLGFKATVGAGQTRSAQVTYGSTQGPVVSAPVAWTRNLNVLALFAPRWYGNSSVFGSRFLASADNTMLPAFETMMRNQYTVTSDPPTTTVATTRSYYDHMHAIYMTLLRRGGPDSTLRRAYDEVRQFRENEVHHSGTYKGQVIGSLISSTNTWPMAIAVVRRQYVLGLLEDYYVSGDPRSLEVAIEIADALAYDTTLRTADYTQTERTPGRTLIGLTAMYQHAQDPKYLSAAKKVVDLAVNHQGAMATKYPNQTGISGLTGAFVQDKNGAWFDPSESSCSGCGSPFMSTLLTEGLVRYYWITGETRVRDSVVKAANWLKRGCYVGGERSYWYVCRDSATGTTPSLNPMFLEMLGFAYQVTGDATFKTQASEILSVNDWGNHIKEFNQGQHGSGAGLHLLSMPAGSVPLTLAQSGFGSTTPSPTRVTKTVKTSMDAYVNQGSPSTNYRGITSIRVGTSPQTEGYFKFAVSGLAGKRVVSAKLRIHVGSNGTVNGPALYATSSTWSESTITWNMRPSVTTSALGDLGAMSPTTWYSYDVTTQVTADGTYSFKVAGKSTDYALIDALEDGAANAAELVIVYQ